MTNIVLENIKSVFDLITLSISYMKGVLKLNISKISRELNVDRNCKKILKWPYKEGYKK